MKYIKDIILILVSIVFIVLFFVSQNDIDTTIVLIGLYVAIVVIIKAFASLIEKNSKNNVNNNLK